MAEQQTSESAGAAAKIQYAIFLLREKFLELIPAEDKKDGLDFNNCLRVLKSKKGLIPENDGNSHDSLVTQLERARRIRNNYSHQNFDVAQFQHDAECLEKIAGMVGLPPEELCLPKPSTKMAFDWKKLKADGNKLYEEGKWIEAMDCYTKAISLNSNAAALYSNRALCELQLGKWELAREDAEDAIELDPGPVKYYRTLSQALFNMSLLKNTIDVCIQGLVLDRTDKVLQDRLRASRALLVKEALMGRPVASGSENSTSHATDDTSNWDQLLDPKVLKMASDVMPEDILHVEFEEFWTCSTLCNDAHKALSSDSEDLRCIREIEALGLFEAAAARGYAEGLYNVGLMYRDGSAELPRDFERALEYFHKAAKQPPYIKVLLGPFVHPNRGVAQSENCIGVFCRDGLAGNQDTGHAFKWFLRSAQHGCPSGMNNLGLALQNGKGCARNLESARSWFTKSAELGLAEAQLNLAELLVNGLGGPIDVETAAELLKNAADQGLPGALNKLQALMRSGCLGATGMTTAPKLVKTKSEQRDREAVFLLGTNYRDGSGGYFKNLDKAEEHLRNASAMNHPEADLALGMLLLDRRKYKKAFQHIKKAAETTGNQDAQFTFGKLLALGHGCERNEKIARRWLLRSGQCRSDVDNVLQCAAKTLEFEQANQLEVDGLSYDERIDRYISKGLIGSVDKRVGAMFEEQSSSIRNHLENPPQPHCGVGPDDVDVQEMLQRAKQGSKVAQRYFQALKVLGRATDALHSGDYSGSLKMFRKYDRLWDPIQIPIDVYLQALKAAREVFGKNPRDADALFCIRMFEAMRKDCDMQELVRMAKTCVSLDPKVAYYHYVLGCMYDFVGNHWDSLRSFERALELEPEPRWLHGKATALRFLNSEPSRVVSQVVIMAYEEYIAANEKDERKIAEAYYCVGEAYLVGMKDERKARECREKARQAEHPSIRLPCFGAVKDDFPPKRDLNMMLALKEISRNKTSAGASTDLTEHTNSSKNVSRCNPCVSSDEHREGDGRRCASCGSAAAQSWCGRCRKVRYCDRQCQKQHWKEHKRECSDACD